MRNTVLTVLCALLMCACRQVTVDYTYAPEQPMAGETVSFTNLSTGGEDFEWSFGDNNTSEDRNPTHVFRQTGTYLVTLKESKSGRTCNKTVRVSSATPSFTASSDSICMFDEVELHAEVWNPYKHETAFRWTLGESVLLVKNSLTDSAVTVCFTQQADAVPVRLEVRMDGATHVTDSLFRVFNKQAPALLSRNTEGDFVQRLYGARTERLRPLEYAQGMQILAAAPELKEAKDTLERKVYFGNDNGLFVANTNGTDTVQLDTKGVNTLTISYLSGHVYYATAEGVFCLPVVRSRNNLTTAEARQLNDLQGVVHIAIDEKGF